MSTPRYLRDALRVIKDAGGLVVDMKHGKHLKIRVDFGQGVKMLVCSLSPSDSRAICNFKRDVARAKQGGYDGTRPV